MATLVASYPVSSGTASAATALATPSFTPADGEIIVVKSLTNNPVTATPSGGGLTFTSRASSNVASNVSVAIHTAVVGASPAAMSVSVAWSGAERRSIVVERWSSATLAATPATNTTKTGVDTAPSATVTTTAANSVVTWVDGDWNESTGTVTYRSGATQELEHLATSSFSGWYAYQTAAVAGAQTIGMTAPPSQKWSMVGIEILDASAVSKPAADSGTGLDSAGIAIPTSATDSGTGTETSSVGIPTPSSDGASGSESVSSSAAVSAPDAQTGTDTLGTTASLTAPLQTATGTDTGKIIIPAGDASSASSAAVQLAGYPAKTDPATGSDGATIETLYGDLVISLYAIHPTTGALVPLPEFTKLTLSPQRNSAGSISLEYPTTGLNFDFLRSVITSDRDLEIEIWNLGSPTGALRGYLQEAAGDDVSEDGLWTFAGGFLELRMAEALVFPQPITTTTTTVTTVKNSDTSYTITTKVVVSLSTGGTPTTTTTVTTATSGSEGVQTSTVATKGEIQFNAATPGGIMNTLFTQAQTRGSLTDIARGFSGTVDSNGLAWPNVVTVKFSPGASYDQILGKLVELGLVEWAVTWTGTSRRLDMWGAQGRGVDRTVGNRPVVLRKARNLLEAPRKWSVRDSGTALLAAGSEGVYRDAADASALARRGRRIEVSASANNLSDPDSVLAYAQSQLAVTTPGLLEVTHGIGFLPGEPRPLVAFDVGDWVYSQTSTTMDRLRVVQWTLTVDAKQNPSGTVTLNDTVTDALVRLQRRLNALAAGDTVVGTSTPSSIEDTVAPAAPTGLVADSLAYQEDVTGDTYASVTLGWAEVTTNVDGSAATDVEAYRIRYKPADIPFVDPNGNPLGNDDAWSVLATTPRTSPYTFSGVAPDTDIDIQVAAFDRAGNQGPWSTNLIHHTAGDNTPPEAPSAPGLAVWFATINESWNGLDLNGAVMAVDTDHVEVWLCQAASFTVPVEASTPTQFDPLSAAPQHVANLFAAGTWNQPDIPYGVGWYGALRAVDRAGNPSALSGIAGPVTAEPLVSQDLINGIIDANKLGPNSVQSQHVVNGAITTAKIVDANIITAKIADLAVNDAKVNTLSVGKVTAGTLSAAVTLSGIIRTGTTGARSEIDGAGIRLYNAAGTATVNLNAATGAATITGEYRTGFTGTRMVFNAAGGQADEIWFYPSSGSAYAVLSTHNHQGQVTQGAINMRGNSVRGDGYTGHVGAWPPEAYVKWGALQGVSYSALSCGQNFATFWAPALALEARGDFPNDGGARRVEVRHRNSGGGIIGSATLHFLSNSANEAQLYNPHNDIGISFAGNTVGMYVGTLNGVPDIITAADFLQSSSRRAKKGERPTKFGDRHALDVVAAIESKLWNYDWENTGPAPRPRKYKRREQRRDGNGMPVEVDGQPVFDEFEVDGPDEPVLGPHVFPIAEDLQALVPELVTVAPEVPGGLTVSLRDTVGVLWQALKELNAKVDALSGPGKIVK